MAFTKGAPRPPGSGRRAGIPNKINRELRGLVLLEEGHDPIRALIAIARHPKASLELKCKANAELAGYIYAKRKSVEVSGADGGPIELSVSAKQSLEARITGIAARIGAPVRAIDTQ